MIEKGIKSGKIVIQVPLKATSQAIQNGSKNFGIKKKKEDVAMVVQGLRQGHYITCTTLNILLSYLNIQSTMHNHMSNQ